MATSEQLRALMETPDLLAAVDATDLAVGERLRRTWPADLVAAATEQAQLRERAADKFSRAGEMLFTRAGLEQASGEMVARHRATRFTAVDGITLDLCSGIGGDLLALGGEQPVVGVDRDGTHALLASHNAAVYDVAAQLVVADVHDVRTQPAAAVFVDPARRSGSADAGADRRGGYSPTLDWCLAVPNPNVCVKAAPGLDRSLVPAGWETEFVAVGRELKEAVLWSPGWATAAARATVLPAGDTLVADPASPPAEVRAPGTYLLDPSPTVTRAGAVADLAADLGAWQIDARIAFLCAERPIRSPFGRSFHVEASLPYSVKRLAGELRRLDIGAIDLRRRGLAGDVDELRRRLRPSGSRRATVMLTRFRDKPWTLICTELPDT
jgi:hypothetical protein